MPLLFRTLDLGKTNATGVQTALPAIPRNVLEAFSIAKLPIWGWKTADDTFPVRAELALETIQQMSLKRVEMHLHLSSVNHDRHDDETLFAVMEEYTANILQALHGQSVHLDICLDLSMEAMCLQTDACKTYLARALEIADVASLHVGRVWEEEWNGVTDMMGRMRTSRRGTVPQLRVHAANIDLLHNTEGVTALTIDQLQGLPESQPPINRWTTLQLALQTQAATLTSLCFDDLWEAERAPESAHVTLPMLAYLDLLHGGGDELYAISVFIGAPNLRVLTVVVSNGSEYVLAPATLDQFPKLQEVKLTLGHLARDSRAQGICSLVQSCAKRNCALSLDISEYEESDLPYPATLDASVARYLVSLHYYCTEATSQKNGSYTRIDLDSIFDATPRVFQRLICFKFAYGDSLYGQAPSGDRHYAGTSHLWRNFMTFLRVSSWPALETMNLEDWHLPDLWIAELARELDAGILPSLSEIKVSEEFPERITGSAEEGAGGTARLAPGIRRVRSRQPSSRRNFDVTASPAP